jgi:hypothetical protein
MTGNTPTPGPTGPPQSPASGWLVLFNYLLPGAGFCAAGRWRRGLMQAAMVATTAAFGWLLHGGVIWPSWSREALDFNLINNLTFLVQMGGGLPSMLSLAASQFHWPVLGGIPEDPYYELGGYYLVVAGAINYFATMNFYDRMVKHDPRFAEQEQAQPESPQ